jgi:hypothetical protein
MLIMNFKNHASFIQFILKMSGCYILESLIFNMIHPSYIQ